MKKTLAILGLTALALSTIAACAVRDAQMFADDTTAVMVTRSPQIKACYDETLKTDSAAAGNVVVAFTVEKKTGAIINPQVVPERTTAPEALGQCVLGSISGLALDPPDQNEGAGVFTWTFTPNAPIEGTVEAAPAEAEAAPAG
jgi:hypothetical protein